jgi:hypothetical protein
MSGDLEDFSRLSDRLCGPILTGHNRERVRNRIGAPEYGRNLDGHDACRFSKIAAPPPRHVQAPLTNVRSVDAIAPNGHGFALDASTGLDL